MEEDVLSWEITSTEQRERNKEFLASLLYAFPVFIGLMMTGLFSEDVDLSARGYIYVLSASTGLYIAVVLLAILINRFRPYNTRVYHLDASGVTISKGAKTKTYTWGDFQCFYTYTESFARSHNTQNERVALKQDLYALADADKKIRGTVFYLKHSLPYLLSWLCKVFVVVYAEPDNSLAVKEFLHRFVPEKEMGTLTDSGLVIYKFR